MLLCYLMQKCDEIFYCLVLQIKEVTHICHLGELSLIIATKNITLYECIFEYVHMKIEREMVTNWYTLGKDATETGLQTGFFRIGCAGKLITHKKTCFIFDLCLNN